MYFCRTSKAVLWERRSENGMLNTGNAFIFSVSLISDTSFLVNAEWRLVCVAWILLLCRRGLWILSAFASILYYPPQ